MENGRRACAAMGTAHDGDDCMARMKPYVAAMLAMCLMIIGNGCTMRIGQKAPGAIGVIDVDGTAASVQPGGDAEAETRAPETLKPEVTPDPNVGLPLQPTLDPNSGLSAGSTPDPNVGLPLYPTPDPNKPMVALTFDDGPSKNTTRILDVLEQYGARATFFVVGTQLEKFQEITKRASELGCEIGNHTYNHKNLTKISPDEIQEQINSLNALILTATGKEVTLVRLPYGAGIKDKTVKANVPYPLIMWTIDTLDWSTRDTESTLKAIRQEVKDGSIILMHDLYEATAAAAETIVPELIEQGYQLVTVSEMFAAKGIPLEAGNYYRNAFGQ